MAQNKVNKVSVEVEFKALKKHFGGVAATVKSLMEAVKSLQTNEIKEIMETQRVMDEVVVANSDAIKKLKTEPLKNGDTREPIEDVIKETLDNSKKEALNDVIKMQQFMDKTISKNAVNVKLLDKEIKGLLKERDNKNSSKAEIEKAMKRLDEEIRKN